MGVPNITEWLRNKVIFVTGATGFVGKVLVEKLLRVSDVEAIYVLIRSKKGVSAKKRWEEVTQNPLYSVVKREKPNALDKVVVIEGDASHVGLGLSQSDQELLIDKVQIVFHSAASVRFDDSLTYALKLNLRGTYYMCELAKQMKRLELFQYVSTAYCNAHLNKEIGENVYEPAHKWRNLLQCLDDERALDIVALKVIANHSNTYTFTKAQAETVVRDFSEHFPAVIFRPTVVIPTLLEPIPGWTDNLNGPMGVTMGVSKGVLRAFMADPDVNLDYAAVDGVVSSLVAAAWDHATSTSTEIKVFNGSYGKKYTLTFGEMVKNGVIVNDLVPMDNSIWYPFLLLMKNSFAYHVMFYLLQFLPAVFIDTVLLIAGYKTILVRLNAKIYLASRALRPFTFKEYEFAHQNFFDLIEKIPVEEKEVFLIDPGSVDVLECMHIYQAGIKKYIFNEKDEDLDKFKRKHWRLYVIDRITRGLLIAGACYFLLTKLSLILFR